jgi:molybdate transport system ATP-binding protein
LVGEAVVSGLRADFVVERAGYRLELALDAAPGETVALLGPNGAGKSTAVAALAGLIPIDEGTVALDGDMLDDPAAGTWVAPEARDIGVVFQDGLLFDHLTLRDNVAFGLRSRGIDGYDETAAEWLGRVGLSGSVSSYPGDLSGGQAQLVALARALATEPRLLLLDEPLSALDVGTRSEIRHVLHDHLEHFAGPRIVITHDPTEAFLLADRLVVLEGGVVTHRGTPDEVRLTPTTSYAADLAGINLVRGSAAVGDVETESHTLHVGDHAVSGPVVATIHPTAISVHAQRPAGSPRNVWQTTVERLESDGARVRLRTGDPLPLVVEVTESARAELDLVVGAAVWLAIKATEIRVTAGD